MKKISNVLRGTHIDLTTKYCNMCGETKKVEDFRKTQSVYFYKEVTFTACEECRS